MWTDFADAGATIEGMVMDKSGNMYIGLYTIPREIKKITPAGQVSTLTVLPYSVGLDALTIDGDSSLNIISQNIDHNLTIVKFNLTTQQSVQTQMDISAYVDGYQLKAKSDTKGNIYLYENSGNNLVKIKPNGQLSGIGKISSNYYEYQPGNGTDATIPSISSVAIDTTNDNVYVMAYGYILRVDTAENVSAVTGHWFDQYKDQIFRVDNGKVSIVNNSARVLYTANVYGVGSIPFMNNYGLVALSFYYDPATGVNFKDFDRRIRLDSGGAIVGTPRSEYSSIGTNYAHNNSTAYTIMGANHYGISTAPMVIRTKQITYRRESFVTTSLPFVWRGRSFNSATDTATYFVANKTEADDIMYMLHLVYEGAPEPKITSTRDCVKGEITLTANTAAKNAISFDGTNMGLIKNTERSGNGELAYYGADWTRNPDNSWKVDFYSSFEVWIKPATVSGTQYLLTRDTVKTHGTFFGYSIQNGKFVYEFTKGISPFVDYKLVSDSNIQPNVWTHVAASYYDSAMHIFVNGKLAGKLQTADRFLNPFYYEAPGSFVSIFPDFSLAGLGSQFGYKGEMDELRLWSTRRNADSIKATMNSIVDPLSPGLGLYYRFDGDVTAGVSDISSSGRTAKLTKPATSVSPSMAAINFASYKWTPGGDTTKSIVVNQASNTLYNLTVTDYKGTPGSDSLLVAPIMQPAKVNCWDNYQLNTATCTWVNVGTQPVRPATACYQTATFNTTTCQWVITGTQPARPATACYESATFNATTCAWLVTGTKPIEPAKANCWDNYQFNITSCTWVNLGTQPARPSTACYQTATFNTSTCQWVVTGTPVRAGTNGTLSVCEGTLLTTTQLFAALGGTPNAGGKWSPALAGAGIYTYTVATIAPCTGSVTATVTVTTVAKIINAGCYSATIARTYSPATNRTTFTYDVCANGCAQQLSYIAFITQTNTPVVSPINGSIYKTVKYSYKVSIPVGVENGKTIYGIKYDVIGKGINTNGDCDKFIFTLAGNISKEAVTVRFKAGTDVINANAECPSGYLKQIFITSQNKKIEQISVSNLTVKAYPNPYQDKVRFEINSPEAGQGSLEVFNVLGQKVKTVYQGHIINGMQSFSLHLPEVLRSTLIYRFTVNGKQITGKLIYAGD